MYLFEIFSNCPKLNGKWNNQLYHIEYSMMKLIRNDFALGGVGASCVKISGSTPTLNITTISYYKYVQMNIYLRRMEEI